MLNNIEIEFKTVVTKDTYQKLLKCFDLENNVFKQTNYYFDSKDLKLNEMRIVLRIREKPGRLYKLTMKSQSEQESYERHVLLSASDAKTMIENGFNTKDYFEDIDLDVNYITSLDNYRASTPYEGGVLFLDKSVYCDITDYEIEYEAHDFKVGEKTFNAFLAKHQISFTPTKRKSERAFACKLDLDK